MIIKQKEQLEAIKSVKENVNITVKWSKTTE